MAQGDFHVAFTSNVKSFVDDLQSQTARIKAVAAELQSALTFKVAPGGELDKFSKALDQKRQQVAGGISTEDRKTISNLSMAVNKLAAAIRAGGGTVPGGGATPPKAKGVGSAVLDVDLSDVKLDIKTGNLKQQANHLQTQVDNLQDGLSKVRAHLKDAAKQAKGTTSTAAGKIDSNLSDLEIGFERIANAIKRAVANTGSVVNTLDDIPASTKRAAQDAAKAQAAAETHETATSKKTRVEKAVEEAYSDPAETLAEPTKKRAKAEKDAAEGAKEVSVADEQLEQATKNRTVAENNAAAAANARATSDRKAAAEPTGPASVAAALARYREKLPDYKGGALAGMGERHEIEDVSQARAMGALTVFRDLDTHLAAVVPDLERFGLTLRDIAPFLDRMAADAKRGFGPNVLVGDTPQGTIDPFRASLDELRGGFEAGHAKLSEQQMRDLAAALDLTEAQVRDVNVAFSALMRQVASGQITGALERALGRLVDDVEQFGGTLGQLAARFRSLPTHDPNIPGGGRPTAHTGTVTTPRGRAAGSGITSIGDAAEVMAASIDYNAAEVQRDARLFILALEIIQESVKHKAGEILAAGKTVGQEGDVWNAFRIIVGQSQETLEGLARSVGLTDAQLKILNDRLVDMRRLVARAEQRAAETRTDATLTRGATSDIGRRVSTGPGTDINALAQALANATLSPQFFAQGQNIRRFSTGHGGGQPDVGEFPEWRKDEVLELNRTIARAEQAWTDFVNSSREGADSAERLEVLNRRIAEVTEKYLALTTSEYQSERAHLEDMQREYANAFERAKTEEARTQASKLLADVEQRLLALKQEELAQTRDFRRSRAVPDPQQFERDFAQRMQAQMERASGLMGALNISGPALFSTDIAKQLRSSDIFQSERAQARERHGDEITPQFIRDTAGLALESMAETVLGRAAKLAAAFDQVEATIRNEGKQVGIAFDEIAALVGAQPVGQGFTGPERDPRLRELAGAQLAVHQAQRGVATAQGVVTPQEIQAAQAKVQAALAAQADLKRKLRAFYKEAGGFTEEQRAAANEALVQAQQEVNRARGSLHEVTSGKDVRRGTEKDIAAAHRKEAEAQAAFDKLRASILAETKELIEGLEAAAAKTARRSSTRFRELDEKYKTAPSTMSEDELMERRSFIQSGLSGERREQYDAAHQLRKDIDEVTSVSNLDKASGLASRKLEELAVAADRYALTQEQLARAMQLINQHIAQAALVDLGRRVDSTEAVSGATSLDDLVARLSALLPQLGAKFDADEARRMGEVVGEGQAKGAAKQSETAAGPKQQVHDPGVVTAVESMHGTLKSLLECCQRLVAAASTGTYPGAPSVAARPTPAVAANQMQFDLGDANVPVNAPVSAQAAAAFTEGVKTLAAPLPANSALNAVNQMLSVSGNRDKANTGTRQYYRREGLGDLMDQNDVLGFSEQLLRSGLGAGNVARETAKVFGITGDAAAELSSAVMRQAEQIRTATNASRRAETQDEKRTAALAELEDRERRLNNVSGQLSEGTVDLVRRLLQLERAMLDAGGGTDAQRAELAQLRGQARLALTGVPGSSSPGGELRGMSGLEGGTAHRFAEDLLAGGNQKVYAQAGRDIVDGTISAATREAQARSNSLGDRLAASMFGTSGFASRFMGSIGTFIVRMASAGLVFGVAHRLRENLMQSLEAEQTFVLIQDAMDATGKSADGLRTKLTEVSTELGVELHDVYAVAAQLVGVFKTTEDIEIGTKVITQLQVISQGALNAKEGVRSLISIVQAFGLEGAEAVTRVGDIATALQNVLSVNIEDSIEGAARIAAQAEALGFSLEQTMTYVAAISQTTGQTGQAAGEQLQRILGALDTGRARAVLQKSGVPQGLFLQDQGRRKVLEYLVENYNDLDEAQQRAIASALGGQRQAAAVQSLLSAGVRIQEAYTAALHSEGEAQERINKLRQEVLTQLKILGQELNNIINNLIRLGALDAFGLLLKGAIAFLGVINRVLSAVNDFFDMSTPMEWAKRLTVGLLTVAAALKLIQSTWRAMRAGAAGGGGIMAELMGVGGMTRDQARESEGPTFGEQWTAGRDKRARARRERRDAAAGLPLSQRLFPSFVGPAARGVVHGPIRPGIDNGRLAGSLYRAGQRLDTAGGEMRLKGYHRTSVLPPRAQVRMGQGVSLLGAGASRASQGITNLGRRMSRLGITSGMASAATAGLSIALMSLMGAMAKSRETAKTRRELYERTYGDPEGEGRSAEEVATQEVGGHAGENIKLRNEILDATAKAEYDFSMKSGVAGFIGGNLGALAQNAWNVVSGQVFQDVGTITPELDEMIGHAGKYFEPLRQDFQSAEQVREAAASVQEDIARAAANIDASDASDADKIAAQAALEQIGESVERSAQNIALRMEGLSNLDFLTSDQIKNLLSMTQAMGALSSETLQQYGGDIAAITAGEVGYAEGSIYEAEVGRISAGGQTAAQRAQSLIRIQEGAVSNLREAYHSEMDGEKKAEIGQQFMQAVSQLDQLRIQAAQAEIDGANALAELYAFTGDYAQANAALQSAVGGLDKKIAKSTDPFEKAQLENQKRQIQRQQTENTLTESQADARLEMARTRNDTIKAETQLALAEEKYAAALEEGSGFSAADIVDLEEEIIGLEQALADHYNAIADARAQYAIDMEQNPLRRAELTYADALRQYKRAVEMDMSEDVLIQMRTARDQALQEIQAQNEALRAARAGRRIGNIENPLRNIRARANEARKELAYIRRTQGRNSPDYENKKAELDALFREERDTLFSIAQARLDLSRAIAEAAGNTVGAARLAVVSAKSALAQVRETYGTRSTEYLTAQADLVSAQAAERDAVRSVQRSADELRIARMPQGDVMGIAQERLRIALEEQAYAAANFHRDSQEYHDAVRGVIDAEQEIADLVNEIADAQSSLAGALASAMGNDIQAAEIALAAARRKLESALANSGGVLSPEVIAAQEEVVNASAAVRDTMLEDALSTIDFNREMEFITADTAMAQLQQLLENKNLTEEQRRSILQQMKGLQDEINSQFEGQFNLGEIRIPTPFEVRRALGMDAVQDHVQHLIDDTVGFFGGSELPTALQDAINSGIAFDASQWRDEMFRDPNLNIPGVIDPTQAAPTAAELQMTTSLNSVAEHTAGMRRSMDEFVAIAQEYMAQPRTVSVQVNGGDIAAVRRAIEEAVGASATSRRVSSGVRRF